MTVVDFKPNNHIPLVLGDDEHWVSFEKAPEFLTLVNPINYEFTTNPHTTVVKSRPISCYKNGLILRVEDPSWKEDWAVFYFLFANDKYFQFGSINEEIWNINEEASLDINKHTVVDYLKLQGYFYQLNDDGSNLILENHQSEFIDMIGYSNELEKQRIHQKLKPPVISGPDQNKVIKVECDVLNGQTILRYKFQVTEKGLIDFDEFKIIMGSHSIFADFTTTRFLDEEETQ